MTRGGGQRIRSCGLVALAIGAGACTTTTDLDSSGFSAPDSTSRRPETATTHSPDESVADPTLLPTIAAPTTSEPKGSEQTTAEPTISTPSLLPTVAEPPTTSSTSPAPTTTLTPDCSGLAVAISASEEYRGADGELRTFELAVPSDYDGTRATPLILNFHETSSTGAQQDEYTEMGSLATERGYIVVSPDSTADPRSWNIPRSVRRLDDFAFAHGLLAELQNTMCIDGARIYVTGHANGGMMAAMLACSEPYEFAAVAVVSAVPTSFCPDEVQPAVIEILGTADTLTVYEGTFTRPGAVGSIRSWAKHAGCIDPPITEPVAAGVEVMRFDGCANDVLLVTIEGGTHPWPGGLVARRQASNSQAGRTFPATDTILDFFDAHVRQD